MMNPLLGTNITSMALQVRKYAAHKRGCRWKPVLLCVRGSGGGKTRLLEELRRNLYVDPAVIPIAITFSNNTPFNDGDSMLVKTGSKYPHILSSQFVSLPIIARMARVFYGMPLEQVQQLMLGQKESLEHNYLAPALYTAFLKLMRDQLAAAGKNTTTLVMFVDGTRELQNVLDLSGHTIGNPLCALWHAVINKIDNGILAVASTDIKKPSMTFTAHWIDILPVQEVLNPADIVENWWTVLQGADPRTKQRFLPIAALLCDLPRGAEAFNKELLQDTAVLGAAKYTTDIVQTLRESVRSRYSTIGALPSAKLMHGIWFSEGVMLTQEAAQCLESSVLTNVLCRNELYRGSQFNGEASFLPRANLLALSLCSKGGDKSFRLAFQDVLSKILNCAVPVQEGEVDRRLVDITALVLGMRIMVAKYSEKSISVHDLLGLGYYDLRIPALGCMIPLTAAKRYDMGSNLATLQYSSRQDRDKALQELRSITVDAASPVALRLSSEGEAFDIVLKVHDPSTERGCHYVFLACETKAVRRLKRKGVHPDRQLFPDQGQRAEHMSTLMEGESIAYVYQSTRSTEHDRVNELDSWVLIERSHMKRFFGPVWELYKALRGSDSAGRAL